MKKPDNINRQDLSMDKQPRVLNMVNIFNFEKSLKIKWIAKLVKHPILPWKYLLKKSLTRLATMDGNWINNIIDKVNSFWMNVFNA